MSKAILSRAITRLGGVAGAALFDRIGTGLRFTRSGGALLDPAQAASKVLKVSIDPEDVLRATHGDPSMAICGSLHMHCPHNSCWGRWGPKCTSAILSRERL